MQNNSEIDINSTVPHTNFSDFSTINTILSTIPKIELESQTQPINKSTIPQMNNENNKKENSDKLEFINETIISENSNMSINNVTNNDLNQIIKISKKLILFIIIILF